MQQSKGGNQKLGVLPAPRLHMFFLDLFLFGQSCKVLLG